MSSFDPSGVASRNGAFLGLDKPIEEARIVILPLPWDVTTSYADGTRFGPGHIIEASYQLDLFHPKCEDPWKIPFSTDTIERGWLTQSSKLRPLAKKYIDSLANEAAIDQKLLKSLNEECEKFHQEVEKVCSQYISQGKTILAIGGEHSVSIGPLQALMKKEKSFSVLHLDAHADLRKDYEDFTYSHASIMNQVLKHAPKNGFGLTQVGIRDVSREEIQFIREDKRVKTFFDWHLNSRQANGESWLSICKEIVGTLGEKVYLSFDIDGLTPDLCPNTGTPVPGGLSFPQLQTLMDVLMDSGKEIVGADLVEVAPDPSSSSEWNGNVGARVLFQMLVAIHLGQPSRSPLRR